jgi:hypothetical protein
MHVAESVGLLFAKRNVFYSQVLHHHSRMALVEKIRVSRMINYTLRNP